MVQSGFYFELGLFNSAPELFPPQMTGEYVMSVLELSCHGTHRTHCQFEKFHPFNLYSFHSLLFSYFDPLWRCFVIRRLWLPS